MLIIAALCTHCGLSKRRKSLS